MTQRGLVAAAAAFLFIGLSTTAFATVQRTFVSRTGLDTNTCAADQPCRTFGAAIAQTLAGGEVVVLDSAGYGPATITQGVTITAPSGVYAGISALSGDGIDISAPAAATVALRNIAINYLGGTGTNGILIDTAGRVEIDHCRITGAFSIGISVQPPALTAIPVIVADSVVRESAWIGINASDGTQLSVTRSRFEHVSANTALAAIDVTGSRTIATVAGSDFFANYFGIASGSETVVQIAGSHFAGNANAVSANGGYVTITDSTFNQDSGSLVFGGSPVVLRAVVTRCAFNRPNTAVTILGTGSTLTMSDSSCSATSTCVAVGTGATVRLSRNTITDNSEGVSNNASTVLSTGDNVFHGNGIDVSGTAMGTVATK